MLVERSPTPSPTPTEFFSLVTSAVENVIYRLSC